MSPARTLVQQLAAVEGSAVAGGVLWVAAGNGLNQVFNVAAGVLVARTLGTEAFGIYGFLLTASVMVASVAGTSFGLTGARYLGAYWPGDAGRAVRIVNASNRVALLIAFSIGMAVALGSFIFESLVRIEGSSSRALFLSASPLITFSILQAVSTGNLSGLSMFRAVGIVQSLRGVVVAATVIPAMMIAGVAGALGALAAAAALSWLAGHLLVARRLGQAPARNQDHPAAGAEHNPLIAFTLPSSLSALTVLPAAWLVQLLLLQYPDGATQIALLNVSLTLRNLIVFVPSQLSSVLVPRLSRLWAATGRKGDALGLVRRSTLAAFWLSAILALAAGAGAELIFKAFAIDSGGRVHLLWITGATSVLMAAAIPVGNLIAATGRMWTGFGLNLIWAAVLLLLAALLIWQGQGAYGAILAFFGAYLVHGIGSAWVCARVAATPHSQP